MSYTELDLSTAVLIYGAQRHTPGTIGGPGEDSYFAFPAMNLDFNQSARLQLDLEGHGNAGCWLYSLLPNDNADDSFQVYYGHPDISTANGTTTTITIPLDEYTINWGDRPEETHLLIEVYGATVHGARWEMTASTTAAVGQYVMLDETPAGNSGEDYIDWENFYTTGCRVWPDVVVTAWTSQSQLTNAWEARAVRWSDAENMLPELGPLATGPAVEYDGTITWVGLVAPGVAFIAVAEDNGLQTAGWIIRVDQATLAVTYVERVVCPKPTYFNNDNALIAEGDNRLLFVGWGQTFPEDPSFKTVLGSITWNGTAPVVTWAFPPPGVTDRGANNYWDATTALVDMGDTFVRFTQDEVFSNDFSVPPVQTIYVYSHPNEGGIPAGNGTLRLTLHAEQFDFDEVYAERIDASTIHLVYQQTRSGLVGFVRTLDTSAWAMSPPVALPGSSNAYFSAHQLDFKSVSKIDDTDIDTGGKSVVAWTNYYTDLPKNGTRVGIWDGSALSDITTVAAYNKAFKPGQPRNVFAFYDHSVIYLDHGKAIAVMTVNERIETLPGVPPANGYAAAVAQLKFSGFDAPPAPSMLTPQINADLLDRGLNFQRAR